MTVLFRRMCKLVCYYFAEIACDSLISPSNGNVVVDGSGVGTVATYSCDTGYTLVGQSTRTCQNSADPHPGPAVDRLAIMSAI